MPESVHGLGTISGIKSPSLTPAPLMAATTALNVTSDVEAATFVMNLPAFGVSLGALTMLPFFLPRQAAFFHLHSPFRS